MGSVVARTFELVLRVLGIPSVVISSKMFKYIPREFRRSSYSLVHYLTNTLLSGRALLCRGSFEGILAGRIGELKLLLDIRKVWKSDYAIVHRSEKDACREILNKEFETVFLEAYSPTPLIAIDFSLWELHSEKESNELLVQLVALLNTVRRYLTDLNVAFVSMPIELERRLRTIVEHRAWIVESVNDVMRLLGSKFHEGIVLDPYAEERLDEHVVRGSSMWVLGGVVDDEYPRPYATYTIHKLFYRELPRRVLMFQGSVVGVPNRINKVVEVLLMTRFDGISLEEAILRCMSTQDRIVRLMHEIQRRFGKTRKVSMQIVKELAKTFGLSDSAIDLVRKKMPHFEFL